MIVKNPMTYMQVICASKLHQILSMTKVSLNYSKIILDMVVNDIGALLLNSLVE